MVARSKVVTAKWGVPAKEPEDLPDFLSNEEIEEKMGGAPRGVFRVWVKKITVVKNRNDDDMLKITAEIFETDKSKKGYNGWVFWENQNVTEAGASFLKQFLKSMGASWSDFQQRTKLKNQNSATEPTEVVAIGPVNFAGSKKVLAKVTTKMGKAQNGYEAKMEIGRWLPKDSDMDESEDIEEEEDELLEDEEELEDEELEEVDEDEELEEEDEEEDEEDEEAELREELNGLSLPDLRKRAKTNDADVKTVGLKKAALIDLIVGQESLDEDEEELEGEEEEELEDDGEDELREELSGLTIGALKQRAKANGEKVAVLKPMKDKAKVIDLIVEQELNGEADDEEPPF
jgi:hypothetical protein